VEGIADIDGFELDRFVRSSGRVDLSAVEWDRVREAPLTRDEVRLLRYMMDIESHTVIFLRDLLATHAAFDPTITAFLSCWNYEEYWHGEAFSRLLGEAGIPVAPDREAVRHDSPYPTRTRRIHAIRRSLGARGYLSHIGTLVGSALTDRDFVAIHMTWGMVNELTTANAYRWMIDRTGNAPLEQVLRAIMKQERRHFAFYRSQARRRLRASARARRLVRWSLDHLWAPVGTGVRPQAETDFVVTHLFNDPEGLVLVRELDETIAALPGLEGTRYLEGALREAAARTDVPFTEAPPAAQATGRTRVPSGVSITSSPSAASSSRNRSLVS
jgi:rubrerythrin